MKMVTFSMPLGDRRTGEELQRKEATGIAAGPFAVHRTPHYIGRAWTVTHVATGCVVQGCLPTKRRALWLAKKLSEFDVWTFTEANAVKEIEPYVLGQIKSLRADAMYGDMQGTAP